MGALTMYETDIWQFPNKTNCPLRSCQMKFDTRELAIVHYTKTHAPHTAICKICKIPQFLLYGPHHMESHYKRMHPHASFPPKVRDIRVSTTMQQHSKKKIPFVFIVNAAKVPRL